MENVNIKSRRRNKVRASRTCVHMLGTAVIYSTICLINGFSIDPAQLLVGVGLTGIMSTLVQNLS